MTTAASTSQSPLCLCGSKRHRWRYRGRPGTEITGLMMMVCEMCMALWLFFDIRPLLPVRGKSGTQTYSPADASPVNSSQVSLSVCQCECVMRQQARQACGLRTRSARAPFKAERARERSRLARKTESPFDLKN